MFRRILLATDFSPHALVAKEAAVQLAKGGGGHLWVLTVLEPLEKPLTMAEEPPEVPPQQWEALLAREGQAIHRKEERRLAREVAKIEAAGIPASRLLREGDPARRPG